jgi:hypothetical protein
MHIGVLIYVIIVENNSHIMTCHTRFSGGKKGAAGMKVLNVVIVFIASDLQCLTTFNNSIIVKILP